MPKENNKDWALEYAQYGWPVFPIYHATSDGKCTCGKSPCSSPGKHPLTKNGFKDATTSQEVIENWWTKWPDANIGIRTGAESNLVVMDIDPRNGGQKSFESIPGWYGELPDTLTVQTGGGGMHLYFTHPGYSVSSVTNLMPGIDRKADGGYVVAPPSNHSSGGTYEFCEKKKGNHHG